MVKTHQNAGDRSSTSRPSVLDAKYQQNSASEVRSSGIHRKQNFKNFLGFNSDAAVSTFTFRFFFRFSLFFVFFFCWAFSRHHFGGKSFWEGF